MITKQLSAEYELMDEGQEGRIIVKAPSFGNEDVYGDIFEPQAFDDDIKRVSKTDRLPMLWQHQPDEPIGNWYKLWKDDTFLYMEGQLTQGIPQADRAYLNMKAGDIKGVSIGFNAIDSKTRRDEKSGDYEGMTFERVSLMENSIVTFPANNMAGVDTIKSMQSEREFEAFLRDAGGYSREQSKAIIAGGYRSYVEKFGNKKQLGARDALRGISSLSDLDKALSVKQ